MNIGFSEIGFYLFALLLLFITPGPVWVALIARALQNGFSGAWPLALGVAVGDLFWPALALLSLGHIAEFSTEILFWLRYLAVAVFVGMGVSLIFAPAQAVKADSALTKEGWLPGFLAGLFVIIGNPKAVLFYIGILPGFFYVGGLGIMDIAVIALCSALVPFAGNLLLGFLVGKGASVISAPARRKRLNQISGFVLMAVGGIILFMGH